MPTPELNRAAAVILRELDGLVSAATPMPWTQSDPSAGQWGWEAERDMGRSPEGLVEAWHADAPNPELFINQWPGGAPANDDVPAVLRVATGDSCTPTRPSIVVVQEAQEQRRQKTNRKTGIVLVKRRQKKEEITQLVQVGKIRFDDKCRVIPFDRRGQDWTRKPKGANKKNGAVKTADIVNLDDYRGAATPWKGLSFLAGKTASNENSTYVAHEHCPTMLWQQREAAQERIRILRRRLGPDMAEALLDAATGCETWRIGNGRGPDDWRAAARGKNLVVESLKILCDTK
ncbi:hypothetical protein J8I29_06725 [Labrys sp. LIt4]|uniref:hypothetical protein n=1 Tax=Labrys sp. LIt4 TaxID=2821355 RepID=UPI001ADF5823|nr:hypothetical protein [Labrys sp. LIt4]MBP0578992.1 hypothetical protein [Labrys sp. LIt4]